jgi:sulfite reductase (NADPH) hemoprotein beta-component
MNATLAQTDRSHDISQPLEKLSPDETLKANSNQLRGQIAEGLDDELTWSVPGTGPKLMKFHGIYQQDNRDIRDERRRQKLEPAFGFMVRIRLPGGVLTPEQWLKIDELGRNYGGESLRLTTRQTFQLHGVLKHNLRSVIQGLGDVKLDTRAACGDDSRGVMCSVNPQVSALHATVYDLAKRSSDHAIPKSGAYREIWYQGRSGAGRRSGRAALRPHLYAAQIQDRLCRAADQRYRHLCAGPSASLPLRRTESSKDSMW